MVDVVDFTVLRHCLFPAMWQRTEILVTVVVVKLRGASLLVDSAGGCTMRLLL